MLADRVEVLTRSRSGALDVQAAELRRIERDLHDGGPGPAGVGGDEPRAGGRAAGEGPGRAAELLSESRASTLTALDELRTVMRGIAPPVLADRGLEGAVHALALDLAVPVTVSGELPAGLPAPVASAAYFAVSECLANVSSTPARAKPWSISVTVTACCRWRVRDDGAGGGQRGRGHRLRG